MHVYAVNRSIDRALPGLEAEQDHTVNLLSNENPYFPIPGLEAKQDHSVNLLSNENPYFPILAWAQMQANAPFGPAEIDH